MALSTNQVAHYKLDDVSDSVGSYTLTNNNSVAFNAAKLGNGADGGSSNTNKSLSRDDAYGMLGSTAKTYSFWGKITTNPTAGNSMMFFRHLYGGSAVGNYANIMYYNNAGSYEIKMPTSPAGMTVAYTLTVGVWYYFAVTVPANNTGNLTCYVNGVAIGTTPNWSQNYALTTRIALLADHVLASNLSGMVDEFTIYSRELSVDELLQIHNSGRANAFPLTDTPLLYGGIAAWKLDEASGNAVDSIGRNTLTNANVTYVAGKINNGALFNSTTDKLATTNYAPFNFERTDAFSISAWIYKNSLGYGGNAPLIAHQNFGGTWIGWKFREPDNTGVLMFQMVNSGATQSIDVSTPAGSIATGSWKHILMTYDGSSNASGVHIYINGVNQILTVVQNNLSTTIKNAEPFNIGNWGDSYNYDGIVDEVSIFNRCLSTVEGSLLYYNGAGQQWGWLLTFATAAAFLLLML